MCQHLWCEIEEQEECVSKLDPAAKGTECGKGKVCVESLSTCFLVFASNNIKILENLSAWTWNFLANISVMLQQGIEV